MKKSLKWAIIIGSILVIVFICLLASNVFFYLSIKNPSAEKVNKYFNTNIPNDSYIEKYMVESGYGTSYVIKVKLNIQSDEVDKVLGYYKKFEKQNQNDYDTPTFSDWGLTKTNYDYTIIDLTSVIKAGTHTQRSLFIAITKPQHGNVSAYLWVDKIGGWKEEKGYK